MLNKQAISPRSDTGGEVKKGGWTSSIRILLAKSEEEKTAK
jgi:hypothetical protein